MATDTPRLFDPGPPDDPPEDASYTVRPTLRRRGLLAAGIHPATRARLLPGEQEHTCGGCGWAAQVQHGRRWYHKCMKAGATRSQATDIRVGWPACTLFVSREDDHA